MNENCALLSIRDLTVSYGMQAPAVSSLSLDIREGEVIGVVGESGSGKSTLGFTIAGLLNKRESAVSGSILYKDSELLNLSLREFRPYRQEQIAVIFQDPQAALNPLLTIDAHLSHALSSSRGPNWRKRIRARKLELLELVGLPDPPRTLRRYPHELSGGMKQRVVIAAAIACDPQLIIADEPTTALDVTVQAQIVSLLQSLCERLGMAVMFISHDLSLVSMIAERVIVMRQGLVVEEGDADVILRRPATAYTRRLIDSIPSLEYSPRGWLEDYSFWRGKEFHG